MYDPVEARKPRAVMENTMKKNTTAVAQEINEEGNKARRVKEPSQRVAGMKAAAKRGEERLANGARKFGNGTKSVAREVVSDIAAGGVGLATTVIAGDLINRSLALGVNMIDAQMGKKNPHTVTIKKGFGHKTMSEADYLNALAKGKKFKGVESDYWLLNHRDQVNTGLAAASYAAGGALGLGAGIATRTTMKATLGGNPSVKKEMEALHQQATSNDPEVYE